MKSIKTAFKQIRRTPYQALAATMILSLNFFAVTAFILISGGLHLVLSYFESTPQVIAFFEKGEDLTNLEIQAIKEKLELTGKLANFKYISTQEAEQIYKQKNQDDPLLNELVDYKILPPSIEISATELTYLPALGAILEAEPKVEDIVLYKDVIDNVNQWIINIRKLGVAVIGFLMILSLLILMVIIGMKVKNKRKEIQIMRLLGASGWYILSPFLVEGIFYGAVGAFLGWLGGFTALQYSTPILMERFGDIISLPIDHNLLLMLLGIMLLAGMITGALGSLLSVSRFIKI